MGAAALWVGRRDADPVRAGAVDSVGEAHREALFVEAERRIDLLP